MGTDVGLAGIRIVGLSHWVFGRLARLVFSSSLVPSDATMATSPSFLFSLSFAALSRSMLCKVLCFCFMLPDLLLRELAMLATLSFRITVDADDLTKLSDRDRGPIPGNGRASRVHTSDKRTSSLVLSLLGGARTGTRVAKTDWERFTAADTDVPAALFFVAQVFLTTTCDDGAFEPSVAALCTVMRGTILPVTEPC